MNEKLTSTVVANNLETEIKRIKTINHLIEVEKLEDRADSEEYREPLSIEVIKEYKILLSFGGPEDGFKLQFDNNDVLVSGVYYMANWGEYVEVPLNDAEADAVYAHYMYGEVSMFGGEK